MAVWVALAGGAGTVIVAAISWFATKRQASGRISTTEATTLWEAAEQIRLELRDEVAFLRARVEVCDQALAVAREELRLAKSEITRLERQLNGPKRGLTT